MGVVSRANARLRALGYQRGEAGVLSVSDDPEWLLLVGTYVRRAPARKSEIIEVVDALPPRHERRRTSRSRA
jgi:hypothetical protein